MVKSLGALDGSGQAGATPSGLRIDALAALDAMPDALYTLDPDLRVLYLNRAAEHQ